MSELFDQSEPGEERRVPEDPPTSARARALLITSVVLVVAFIGFTGFASFWTERLWFDSVGFQTVFSTLVLTKVLLFVVFAAVMGLIVAGNIWVAYRLRPMFRPSSPEQAGLDRYREVIVPIRRWLVLGVSIFIGAFAGSSASGQWRTFLMWRNGVPFGRNDPFFSRDLGFYVFDLPWLHYLVDFVMAATVVALMASVLVHYLFGGIQLQNRQDRFSPGAQAQLSVLVGVFVLAKAGDYWLDRFDLLSQNGNLISGMTYTADKAVLPARNILIWIAVICAILFFANVWRRTWLLPGVGLALLVLSSVLMGMIWPAIVQRFQVDPTEADKEAPYIARNIAATRDAYDLADATIEQYNGTSSLPDEELAAVAKADPGIRLVDPRLVQPIFEQRQQVRGYYSVADILDVDRYIIDGQDRDLVLGTRELDQNGLPENSKNWANLHTVYTHGYGLIAAYGNQRPEDNGPQIVSGDEPAWAEVDIPPRGQLTELSPDGYEGRIYFGENSPDFSIVGKSTPDSSDIELDLPGGSDEGGAESTTTYDGASGVPVSGLLNQVLFALKFGEPNLVLSERVHDNSKILFNREPREMLAKVAPWLIVDEDPFPAVVDGRVVWLLDGYTTTDRYPLSERASFEEMTADALAQNTAFTTLPTDEINYMRNAVKAVVDAYDGTVTLYAWDEEDPILKAWMSAFPGTVQPKSEIPEDILAHMRYPEDMFKVQRYQFASYHVTDPSDFYERNDQWEVPVDPETQNTFQPPYRLTVETPDSNGPVFSLTSVYVPAKRNNLAAFVTVDAAAQREGYGTLRVLRLSSTSNIPGPSLIANQFRTDPKIQNELLAFTRTNAKAEYGNLLTLPVGGGLLYVQPLYVARDTGVGTYPVLRRVLVSLGDESGIGTTFEEAIDDVLGLQPGSTPPPDIGTPGTGDGNGEPGPPVSQGVRTLLQEASDFFTKADKALADGDLAAYANFTSKAQDKLNEALALADKQAGTSG